LYWSQGASTQALGEMRPHRGGFTLVAVSHNVTPSFGN